MSAEHDSSRPWPALPYPDWADTCATLHMWTQIVGKIRLASTPMTNHWWNSPLYVTGSGLTTGAMPHRGGAFEIAFDFCTHQLEFRTSAGQRDAFPLRAQSVAAFYTEVMERLAELGMPVRIWTTPVEVAEAIPFERDSIHGAYDPEAANRFWRTLVSADRVMNRFRAEFLGKASPVHFFWGSFDLAATRFSGRRAPEHPGGVPHLGDWVVREAYSHECSSCGFWPGNGGFGQAAFYSYAYPEPDGFAAARISVPGAYYDPKLREFILPLDALRASSDPDDALLRFLRETYAAAADHGEWDRAALER